jgi:hypothetical protein
VNRGPVCSRRRDPPAVINILVFLPRIVELILRLIRGSLHKIAQNRESGIPPDPPGSRGISGSPQCGRSAELLLGISLQLLSVGRQARSTRGRSVFSGMRSPLGARTAAPARMSAASAPGGPTWPPGSGEGVRRSSCDQVRAPPATRRADDLAVLLILLALTGLPVLLGPSGQLFPSSST